jgi:FkbM family methyltransferase
MSHDDALLAEQRFLAQVRIALEDHLRKQGLDPRAPPAEVEFPSASLDAQARPRFSMCLPASLITRDLGAAHLFYHDLLGRGFEFGLRRFLDLHLRSDDVFVDVGAHWGIHALTAATVLPHQVGVLAIEAHPDNAARLRQWVALNQLDGDIEVVSKAIGEREGIAQLWTSGSSMGHSLRSERHEQGSVPIDVEATTIDRLLGDRRHLRWRRFWLKIDVEGNELEALTGAQALFAREHVAAVIWEKSVFHAPGTQALRDRSVWDFLDSRGFRHFRMEDESRGGALLALEDRNAVCNVLSLAPDVVPKDRYG